MRSQAMGCDPSPRNPSTAEDQLRKTATMEMPQAKAAKPRNSLKIRRCVSSSIKALPAHKNDRGAEPCIVGRQRNLQNSVGVRISLNRGAIPQVRHHMDPVGGDREIAGLATPRPTPCSNRRRTSIGTSAALSDLEMDTLISYNPIKSWLFVIQNAIRVLTKSPKRAWKSQGWDAFPRNTSFERVALRGVALDLPYADGHVRVCHGQHVLPKAYVARKRVSLLGTSDFHSQAGSFSSTPRPPKRRLKYPNRGQERSMGGC
jgi:hypothetical protein